jgi:hypothetical protein
MSAPYAHRPARYVALLAVVLLLVLAGAARAATTFTSAGPITLTGFAGLGSTSVPYPSTIAVAGLTGTVTKVVVTLTGMTKPVAVRDLDFLLVSPLGEKMVLFSDAGGGSATDVTLIFDDGAAAPMAANAFPVVSGTFQPTNWTAGNSPCVSQIGNEPDPDVFPSPAPAGPYGSALSIFNGDDPNGTWSLYAVMDCVGSGPGTLTSWSMTFTTTPARTWSFSAAPGKHPNPHWGTAPGMGVLGFSLNGLQTVALDGTRTWYASTLVRAAR